jgi:hypothetical protein
MRQIQRRLINSEQVAKHHQSPDARYHAALLDREEHAPTEAGRYIFY